VILPVFKTGGRSSRVTVCSTHTHFRHTDCVTLFPTPQVNLSMDSIAPWYPGTRHPILPPNAHAQRRLQLPAVPVKFVIAKVGFTGLPIRRHIDEVWGRGAVDLVDVLHVRVV
jgi:hypothetical protein